MPLFFVFSLLVVLVIDAYADPVPSVAVQEAMLQAELNNRFETYDRPKATSYYDDMEDHLEQDQLARDVLADGMPDHLTSFADGTG